MKIANEQGRSMGKRTGVGGMVSMLCAFTFGCASPVTDHPEFDLSRELSELDVVDCVVEGAVRQVGRSFAYQEQPRMARVTEFECASMGGTFVAYDATRPDAVMEKWLSFAEGGDPDAQHRLGLLYEGAMGAAPDYKKAAYWYGQAADSGHRGAMSSLSVLYEKGLGVEKDVLKALNLYRESSGLSGDSLMLSSTAYAEIEEAKGELTDEIGMLRTQREALTAQVSALTRSSASRDAASAKKVKALQSLVSDLNQKVSKKEEVLVAMPSYRLLQRDANPSRVTEFDFPKLPTKKLGKRTVGQFYALVIGNTKYEKMPDLQTPRNDAEVIASLLTNRFGFSTQLLLDANEEEIKRAIHKLNGVAGEKDNILLYFAGHGHRKKGTDRARLNGYWLPTNADQDQDVNWVDNWWVTNHLDTSIAKRALVIADSCYGGVFSTDLPIGPVTQLPPLGEADFEKKLERKSRFVLASGGEQPVLDATGPGSEHSVFAGALIEVLQQSEGPMSVVELYGRVFDRMYDALKSTGIKQEPELRVIRAAGHQSEGDFFFVAN
ncbi:MAG: caspase family protein [Myxococcota bacterium]